MSTIYDASTLIESTIAELVGTEAEAKDAEEIALARYREATGIRQPMTNDIAALCAARDKLPGQFANERASARCREERRRRETGA